MACKHGKFRRRATHQGTSPLALTNSVWICAQSDPIKKEPGKDPWCRSGTTVNEGAGKMLVVAVGTDSEWGKTLALVSEAGDDMTPLQEQLKGERMHPGIPSWEPGRSRATWGAPCQCFWMRPLAQDCRS